MFWLLTLLCSRCDVAMSNLMLIFTRFLVICVIQASMKTIGEEDRYFSRVSLRSDPLVLNFNHLSILLSVFPWFEYVLKFYFHMLGCLHLEFQQNPSRTQTQVLDYQVLCWRCHLMAGMALLLNMRLIGLYSCSLHKKYCPSEMPLWLIYASLFSVCPLFVHLPCTCRHVHPHKRHAFTFLLM